jgi:hypothetical protein
MSVRIAAKRRAIQVTALSAMGRAKSKWTTRHYLVPKQGADNPDSENSTSVLSMQVCVSSRAGGTKTRSSA